MKHKLVEIAGYVDVINMYDTIAPTHHQPTIGMLAIGIGTCVLPPRSCVGSTYV